MNVLSKRKSVSAVETDNFYYGLASNYMHKQSTSHTWLHSPWMLCNVSIHNIEGRTSIWMFHFKLISVNWHIIYLMPQTSCFYCNFHCKEILMHFLHSHNDPVQDVLFVNVKIWFHVFPRSNTCGFILITCNYPLFSLNVLGPEFIGM